ncbi:MAG: ATP-binding protein [Lachnospiraceae bacterium]|nr:ATP-binding protein [Lachnospiraceae bacterium]
MAKDNLITTSFRLNMNNPKHVKINNVLKNLNPQIYKSRNQFMIDAAVFFIEHYGDENFMERKENEEMHLVTREELEVIKKELVQTAMTEARREVIRLLGGVIAGAKVTNHETNNNIAQGVPLQQDDEVISDYALKCMDYEEGED